VQGGKRQQSGGGFAAAVLVCATERTRQGVRQSTPRSIKHNGYQAAVQIQGRKTAYRQIAALPQTISADNLAGVQPAGNTNQAREARRNAQARRAPARRRTTKQTAQ